MIYVMTLANKPRYLREAIRSVREQTRQDLIHIIALDNGIGWDGKYPPAVWFNREAEKLPTDSYVIWLSDDDLLMPRCLEYLAGYLDAHPDVGACYGGSEVVLEEEDGTRNPWGRLPDFPEKLEANGWPSFDLKNQPACVIDGGCVMVRRSALEITARPWMNEAANTWLARLTDAHYMNQVANAVGIVPVGEFVLVNRVTPESAHCHPGKDGKRDVVDWTEGTRKWGD